MGVFSTNTNKWSDNLEDPEKAIIIDSWEEIDEAITDVCRSLLHRYIKLNNQDLENLSRSIFGASRDVTTFLRISLLGGTENPNLRLDPAALSWLLRFSELLEKGVQDKLIEVNIETFIHELIVRLILLKRESIRLKTNWLTPLFDRIIYVLIFSHDPELYAPLMKLWDEI